VNEHLSQEEIDTLLNGVDGGDIDTEPDRLADDGTAQSYDLGSQDRIIRGRMPTLDMVNERFTRNMRISMFNMLRRTTEVAVSGVKIVKFSEYVRGLFMPTSLNLINIKPLRGTGLFVIDPKLVFATVDNFFGGDGRFHTRIEGREFTPTETRVIQLLINQAFSDITGYSEQDALGMTPSILQSGLQSPDFFQNMWHAINTQGFWQGEIINRRKNGETYTQWMSINTIHDNDKNILNYISLFNDITHINRVDSISIT